MTNQERYYVIRVKNHDQAEEAPTIEAIPNSVYISEQNFQDITKPEILGYMIAHFLLKSESRIFLHALVKELGAEAVELAIDSRKHPFPQVIDDKSITNMTLIEAFKDRFQKIVDQLASPDLARTITDNLAQEESEDPS